MKKLRQLDVFIDVTTKVGRVTLPVGSQNNFSFQYDPVWIKTGFPISPYIPFNGRAEPSSIENYLRNLLPEGEALEQMIQNTSVSRNNTFDLIRMLGAETSGALSFWLIGSKPEANCFRNISDEEWMERLEYSQEPLVYWDGKVRLSVAGVQRKLNLLKMNNQFGFGDSKLSSNCILKFESDKVPCIAINEFFCMTLAKSIGMDVANVELTRIGNTRTLIVERFDRNFIAEQNIVQCKHVIDGCQVTDLPPSYKYERQNGDSGDGVYLRDGVSFPRLLKVKTSDAVSTRMKITQWMIFNLATLNYDAHGKNISFFVESSGIELAPFYDLVNIEAIAQEQLKINTLSDQTITGNGRGESIPQYFAMSIGGWQREDFMEPPKGNFQCPVTSYDLAEFGELVGYSGSEMATLLIDTVEAIEKNLKVAIKRCMSQGIDNKERQHIELCVSLIRAECKHLLEQAEGVPNMYELL